MNFESPEKEIVSSSELKKRPNETEEEYNARGVEFLRKFRTGQIEIIPAPVEQQEQEAQLELDIHLAEEKKKKTQKISLSAAKKNKKKTQKIGGVEFPVVSEQEQAEIDRKRAKMPYLDLN